MNVIPMHAIQNVTEVLMVDVFQSDYRQMVILQQLLASTIHSNADPVRLARIVSSMKHVTQPKRAFHPIV